MRSKEKSLIPLGLDDPELPTRFNCIIIPTYLSVF